MDDKDILEFLNSYKAKLLEEKKHVESLRISKQEKDSCNEILCNNNERAVTNISKDSNVITASTAIQLPQVQESSSSPTKDENSSMLRKNETSNNNANSKRTTEPTSFLGFGEYEERRQKYINERIADYKEYLRKQKENIPTNSKTIKSKSYKTISNEKETNIRIRDKQNVDRNLFLDHKSNETKETKQTKSVGIQTDIQGIDLPLVVVANNNVSTKKVSNSISTENVGQANTSVATNTSTPASTEEMNDNPGNQLAVKIDKVQIGTQNIIVPERHVPSSSFTYLNPRSRLLADLKHSYLPSFVNSSSNETTATSTDDDEYKLKKLKWEKARQRDEYHEELRQQIEEKQRLALERAERERREEQALTKRLERQLQQLKEEQEMEKLRQAAREEKLRTISDDLWKRHKELEKSREQQDLGCLYQANGIYKQYKSKIDSLNKLQNSNKSDRILQSFDKSENSSTKTLTNNRIANDRISPAIKKNTKQKLTKQDTKKTVEQSNSVDDSLPIPILRANSPIANNLKYSSVVDSKASNSPAMQQVERKWMIPAVKKNIVKRTDPITNNQNKNVLTQLGAIRLQLQQEQLRLDRTLQEKVANKIKRSNVNKS